MERFFLPFFKESNSKNSLFGCTVDSPVDGQLSAKFPKLCVSEDRAPRKVCGLWG